MGALTIPIVGFVVAIGGATIWENLSDKDFRLGFFVAKVLGLWILCVPVLYFLFIALFVGTFSING